MPKGTKDDMQVNVAGLRRNIKNLAHNYSDAQIKVREATSNDPWGPSSTLMAEIADLTYNVMAFTEIMHMIWKRLNDHGKNWRHVYKALVLMEYLIKTGTEKVAMQCKENIFAIETLKDFQHIEEGKDQGLHVREKAKQLSILLQDDERLKNERARALKAKERFAQSTSAFGSDGTLDTPSSPAFPTMGGSRDSSGTIGELETARPQTAGEEDLQLQLALAMSREEAERDERRRRSDYVRLQLALSQSEQDFKGTPTDGKPGGDGSQQSHLLDLLDVNLGNPVMPAAGAAATAASDPWGTPPTPPQRPQQPSVDPWSSSTVSSGAVSPPLADPWAPRTLPPPPIPPAPITAAAAPTSTLRRDPWLPLAHNQSPPLNMLSSPSSDLEDFDIISNRSRLQKSNGTTVNNNNSNSNGSTMSPDPFDLNLLGDSLSGTNANGPALPAKKTPQSFLGENSALVNLDNLIKPVNGPGNDNIFGVSTGLHLSQSSANPFSLETQQATKPNLFQTQTQPRLTMNEIKQQPSLAMGLTQQDPWAPVSSSSPWAPAPSQSHSNTPNPFLS
ncbi:epsin homolog lqf isoform X2 [Arctopsyche grandis]|uniref:epsin homolog lqf isoform X2 n=1 Tax=Arctopsyche grandis TaxID=121162 RepID=UPI00406D6E36